VAVDRPSPRLPREGVTATTLPQSDFGNPDCCGCLNGVITGGRAEIVCNECGAVLRTVPASELQTALDEMESTLDVASAMCPYCRSVNLFPGFSEVVAFTRRDCSRGVDPSGMH
jgi:ribosomal protein S27E